MTPHVFDFGFEGLIGFNMVESEFSNQFFQPRLTERLVCESLELIRDVDISTVASRTAPINVIRRHLRRLDHHDCGRSVHIGYHQQEADRGAQIPAKNMQTASRRCL